MRPASRIGVELLIVLAVAAGPLVRSAHADPIYQVTDLGAIQAVGLNNAGQVLGQVAPNTPYSGAPVTYMVYNSYGSNAGQQSAVPLGDANAINNNGIVAGQKAYTPTSPMGGPVLYDSNSPTGNPTALNTSLPSVPAYWGWNGPIAGMNDSNQVVGNANMLAQPGSSYQSGNVNTGPFHAYLSSGGTVTDLGTLGGFTSAATAINNAGQVVGTADLANGTSHAFLYSGGKMIDLGGVAGDSINTATAINASGQVVGYSTDYHTASSFLYSNGKVTSLGGLGGSTWTEAMGINASGAIVGSSNGLAFVDKNGAMTDLNTLIPSSSDFQLHSAQFINDAGQIVAWGVDQRGVVNEYLLTPAGMPAPVAPVLTGSEVPEPTTLAFAALLGGLSCARWGYRQLGRIRSGAGPDASAEN